MLDIVGLLGLLVGLAAVVWLAAATLFRGPRRWAAWVALVGLALFFANMMAPTSMGSKEPTPAPTTTGTALLDMTAEPQQTAVAGKEVRYACSQPPVFTGEAGSEFYDAGIRYSMMTSASYPATPRATAGPRTVWVSLGARNEKAMPVRSNPWFDFWLMPLSGSATMPDPPQPIRVDVMEIGGPVPLPKGEALLLGPGTACYLALTFQIPASAERASFNVGYVQAFTIDLTSGGTQRQ